MRKAKSDPRYGIGREILAAEVKRLAPRLGEAKVVFECAEGVWFGFGNVKFLNKPREIGNHGHWPTRYRAVYAVWGEGGVARRLPEIGMEEIYERLSVLTGLSSTIDRR